MSRASLARWVSIVGHPFVLLLFFVAVGAADRLPWRHVLVATGLVFLLAVLPMTLYLWRQAHRGVSNFDVSARELRGPVYALGLGSGVVLVGIFYGLGAPTALLQGLFVGIGLVILASLINRRLKVSMHACFAAWTTCGLWSIEPRLSLVLGAFSLLIFWSRLELRRHTAREVVAGAALGSLMAVPLFFIG